MEMEQLVRAFKRPAFVLIAAATLPALATDYYWIGGPVGYWADGSNWSLTAGGDAANTYPNSGVNIRTNPSDSVYFLSDAEVVVEDDKYAVSLNASNAVVACTGGGSLKTAFSNNSGTFQLLGTGTFCMKGIKFVLPYNTKGLESAIIETPIIVEGSGNNIYFAPGNSRTTKLILRTAISGTGDLEFEAGNLDQTTLNLLGGDFTGFSGTLTINAKAGFPVDGGARCVLGSKVTGGTWEIQFRNSGGTLAFAEGAARDVSNAIKNSTAPIKVDTGSDFIIWATALASSNVGGLVKEGSGTLMLTAAPAYTGMTTVEEGTLVVPGSTTIEKLSVAEDASFVISGNDGETVTITEFAEGTTSANVTAASGLSLSWDGNTATITRAVQTFVWTGVDGSDWNVPGNWVLSDGTPTLLLPHYTDTVSFTNNATVTVNGSYSVGNIYPNAGIVVTFVRSGNSNGRLSSIANLGQESTAGDRIVLDGVDLESVPIPDNVTHDWHADIEIASNSIVTNTIYCNCANKNSPPALRLMGDLTGSGNLFLSRSGNTLGRGGVSLYGNNEAFAGVCIIRSGDSTRGPATFCSATAGSALARWVYTGDVAQNKLARSGSAMTDNWPNSVLKLGTYEGKSYIFGFDSPIADGATLEMGGANMDFSCSLSAKCRTNADRGHKNITLEKIGAGIMTFGNELGQPYISTWKFSDGTLCFANNAITNSFDGGGYSGGSNKNASFVFAGGAVAFDRSIEDDGAYPDISPYIKDSASNIVVETFAEQTVTWSTALAASNKGGLTKKGEGTLTLSEKPLYKGVTTVEAGELVVPQGTELVVNALSAGTLTGATVTKYEYAPNAVLTAPATSGSVTYDAPLDISNLASVDASGVTLVKGTPYVVASAPVITGYTRESLAAVELTLPEGVDPEKWVLKVMGVDGRRSLCVAGAENPLFIILK